MNKRFLKYILSSIFGLALLLGLWSLIAHVANIPAFILPKPTEVWNAFIKEQSLLFAASYNTGIHALIGFLAAAFFGFIVAWVFSVTPRLYPITYPWLLILQLTPISIITPILVLWLGHNATSIAVVSFLICFFPIVITTTAGLKSTPRSMHELFNLMNASRFQTFLHLKLPHTLPYYLTGLCTAATLAPIGAITGDIFLGSSANGQMGLGYLVTTYYAQLKIPALFATALLSCVLGFAFVFSVYLLDWYVLRKWHESYTKNQ